MDMDPTVLDHGIIPNQNIIELVSDYWWGGG